MRKLSNEKLLIYQKTIICMNSELFPFFNFFSPSSSHFSSLVVETLFVPFFSKTTDAHPLKKKMVGFIWVKDPYSNQYLLRFF